MGFFEMISDRAAPIIKDHSKIHREASTMDDPDIPPSPMPNGRINYPRCERVVDQSAHVNREKSYPVCEKR
jgi:hypothetical protein